MFPVYINNCTNKIYERRGRYRYMNQMLLFEHISVLWRDAFVTEWRRNWIQNNNTESKLYQNNKIIEKKYLENCERK